MSLNSKAPTGRLYASLGQRPGFTYKMKSKALKGRPKPCHSPSRASTSISFSAQKTARGSSPMASAIPFMLTWPLSCKTSVALPCSSTLSKTTFTSSLNWLAPSRSVPLSRMSKRHLPNGLKHRPVSLPDLRGRQVTERSPSPNPTCQPSVNTSRTSSNIIGKNRSRRNTGRFWSDTKLPSMNGMCGIDATIWVAPSGLDSFSMPNPGRCPGLAWRCPFGAQEGAASQAPTERNHARNVRAFDPIFPNWNALRSEMSFSKAPTGRHHTSLGQRPRFWATSPITAPTGRSISSPGQRPGSIDRPNIKALKGRSNRNGGAA
jgi:hypothetical protein